MIEGLLIEGFIYGIMVLGVFITFRVLDFPDLTVDGTFPLGAALMAVFIINGYNLILAIILSFIGGFIAGMITALIHNKLKVPQLLAGIITMIMLYSINIRILGSANVQLLKVETIFTKVIDAFSGILSSDIAQLLFIVVIVIILKIALDTFFRTDLGLTLGALGNNQQMVISQGVNPEWLKIIGVGLSNGLVAISGAFAAQYFKFADVSLGQGIIIAGLTSVMIGEFLIRSNRISFLTLRVLLGSIIFRGIMFFGRFYGFHIKMKSTDLKLVTGLLIIVCLIITKIKKPAKKKKE
jgi:putative ABC transport system permease protein